MSSLVALNSSNLCKIFLKTYADLPDIRASSFPVQFEEKKKANGDH
jgi:hypothetical protein